MSLPRNLFVIGWICCTCVGMYWLHDYAGTPSDEGVLVSAWPVESQLPECQSPRLLMFVHPLCPCTRASLSELERLLPQHSNRILLVSGIPSNAHFSPQPSIAEQPWADSFVYQWAAANRVRVVNDVGGFEAQRFGAATSGQCAIYGGSGELLFRGGLTNSRGHAGLSRGSTAAQQLLAGRPTAIRQHPVFGCRLVGNMTQQERN